MKTQAIPLTNEMEVTTKGNGTIRGALLMMLGSAGLFGLWKADEFRALKWQEFRHAVQLDENQKTLAHLLPVNTKGKMVLPSDMSIEQLKAALAIQVDRNDALTSLIETINRMSEQ